MGIKKTQAQIQVLSVISLVTNEDTVTIASFSDSGEEEKLALTTQPDISQPVGTRSGKSYSKQSTKTYGTQQATT